MRLRRFGGFFFTTANAVAQKILFRTFFSDGYNAVANSLLLPRPFMTSQMVAFSDVVGKVKDFFGVLLEANKRLEDDAKENAKDYDIEMLTGNESEYIEMDLMLGVADLHTPEAVAAAESAIAGFQPVISLAASSSETGSEDDSDDSSDNNGNDGNDNGDQLTCAPTKPNRSKLPDDDSSSSSEPSRNCKPKKRPKIVELS